jgi:hypothetical protein
VAKELDLDQIKKILESGDFDQFVGVVEGNFFDGKKEPYRLSDGREKLELAKDVSSFANAEGGAIVIGAVTKKDDVIAAEIVTGIHPFPRALVVVSDYLNVLNTWIFPNIPTLRIKWYESKKHKHKGVVGIIVENESHLWRPFLMTKHVEPDGKLSTTLIGYAKRETDKSAPKTVHHLHVLIQAGLRFEGGGAIPPPPSTTPPSTPPATDSSLGFPRVPVGEDRVEVIPPKVTTVLPDSSRVKERIEKAVEDASLTIRPIFILAAAPHEAAELEGLFSSRGSEIVGLLEHPPKLRRSGFAPDAGSDSRNVRGELRRTVIPEYKLLEFWQDGTIIFVGAGDADFLSWGSKSPDHLKINQLALIESTYVFCKMVRQVYKHARPRPTTVLYRIGLRRMTVKKPCVLSSGIVDIFPRGESKPASGSGKEFETLLPFGEDAGSVAFRLVALVYRWFGFDDDEVPYAETEGVTQIIRENLILSLTNR